MKIVLTTLEIQDLFHKVYGFTDIQFKVTVKRKGAKSDEVGSIIFEQITKDDVCSTQLEQS